MKNTFSKNEKLCNYSHIQQLFSEGKSVKNFPLKLIYIPIETTCQTPIKVLISVPRKGIKKAVMRNYIKRIIRESYRLQKNNFSIPQKQYAIAFMYISKEKTNYQEIFDAVRQLSVLWKEQIQQSL